MTPPSPQHGNAEGRLLPSGTRGESLRSLTRRGWLRGAFDVGRLRFPRAGQASTLRELGARHVAYGATPERYIVVGEVSIASLAEIAGEAWRAEHELAWRAAFAVIADAMLSGARDAEVDLAA